MEKAFRFRIYPTEEQKILFAKTFGCVRWVWNHFLTQCEEAYHNGQTRPNAAVMSRELTQLKQENEWLKEPDKNALQRTVKYLDKAYQRFFKVQQAGPRVTDKKLKWLVKHPNHVFSNFDLNGHPQFKRKHDQQRSYSTAMTNNNIAITYTHVKLPKIGLVRYRDNRHKVEGRILNATITQEASGKYYVSLCCTDVVKNNGCPKTNKSIGIDLGIKEFLITSDGLKIENQRFLKKRLQRLKFLQRTLSRKTKGSKRYERNRKSVAVCHERIRHSRLDFQQQITTWLAQNYDVICVETLKVKNMIKNHKLAQAIADVAWGQFITLLTYKMAWTNKKLIKIDTYFPSSQICSYCRYKNSAVKDLSVRTWICPECSANHDRDINAAQNILAEGLKSLDQ